MSWHRIQAGSGVLAQYARRKPLNAVAELIWNAVDAEAANVYLTINSSSVSETPDSAQHVTTIRITDDGHGITPQIADSTFTMRGDSWKRNLNGRSLNNLRPLHGQAGVGRFFAYSIGRAVKWSSVSQIEGSTEHVLLEIFGDKSKIDGFEVSDPIKTLEPTGTSVHIDIEQGNPLPSLISDETQSELTAIFAPYLLFTPGIVIHLNEASLDPRMVIE